MRDLPLFLGIGVYFVSSLGGVSIVKFLNYHYCFTSWWIFALLSRSTWVLAALMHCILQYREQVTLRISFPQLRLYLLIAVGLSLVEVMNAFSMSKLPGSLYMLLKGSDVGWSMILSFFMLHKRYSRTKVAAACLILMGIGAAFVLDVMQTDTQTSSRKETTQIPSTPVVAMLCLVGAFLNSLCSVGTEATLKQTLKAEQDRLLLQQSQQQPGPPSKLLLSNSYSMWTSFLSFGLLVVPVSLLHKNENSDIHEFNNSTMQSCPVSQHNEPASAALARPRTILLAIGLCLALLGISRFLERLCKHFICVYDSAVTFSMVQAARRWLGIYIVGLLFQEGFANGMIAGSLISGAGFILHSYASSKEAANKSHAYKKLESNLSDSNANGDETELKGTLDDAIEMTEHTSREIG